MSKDQHARRLAGRLAVILATSYPGVLFAADRYYVGPANGSWNNAANWSATLGGPGGAGVPVANDFVFLRNSDTANRNIVLDVSTPNFARLRIGNNGTGLTALVQSGNFNISSVAEFEGSSSLGINSSGVHTQSAGLNTITWFLSLGDDPGTGTGTYNLSDTGSIILNATAVGAPSNPGMYVGNNENGVFNQNGGTVAVGTTNAVPLFVGVNGNGVGLGMGVGTYNLMAGSMSIMGNEYIGYNGMGTVNQSGGTHKVGTAAIPAGILLGFAAASTGNYLLSAGGLIVTDDEYVGLSGAATFTQSGGTNTVGSVALPKNLHLGFGTTGKGTYLLSDSGALNPNGNEYVGNAGAGTFNQSGGTHTFLGGGSLYLGFAASGAGTYLLSAGGVLNGYEELVGYGGTGLFNQTGGANNMLGLQLGGNGGAVKGTGTYLLSGGSSLNCTGRVYVGAGGAGTFIQSGGTVQVNYDLSVAEVTGGGTTTGYYALQNGALNVAGIEYVGGFDGDGTFNQSNGQNSTSTLTIGAGNGGSGNYLLSGGTLTVVGEEQLGSSGAGTLTQSGGTHVIGSALAPANLTVGYAQFGRFLMSGPSTLTVWGDLYLSISSAGRFNQSGGSTTINGNAFIAGDSLGATGNSGILSISAGSMSVAGTLKIWNVFSTDSAVNLSNGYLAVGSLDTDGNPSRFNWTGGTFAITRGLTIGPGGGLGSTASIASTFINNGAVTLAGGSTIGPGQFINQNFLTGYGTLGGSGGITNSGLIQPTGGNLIVTNTGTFSNIGNIELAGSSQLQLNGGSLSNSGAISLANATINGTATLNNNIDGVIYGSGNISAPFVNNGLLQVDNGNLSVLSFSNYGIIELAGSAGNLRGGAIANEDIIEGFGKVSSAITNHGQIKAVNGTLILAGQVINGSTGQIVAPTGGNILVQSIPVGNTGLISLLGGTYDTNGQAMLNASDGVINGRGTLRSGGVTNNGSMTFSAGLTDFFGAVTNNGHITVTGGSTTTFYNAVTGNPGSNLRIDANSAAVFLGNVSVGFVTGSGTAYYDGTAIGGPLVNDGNSFVASGASLSADYIRQNLLSVSGNVAIHPNGSAANFSRLASLSITGGAVDLADNDLIVDATSLSTISQYIKTAFNGGGWTGNGLSSSIAQSTTGSAHKTALGYATAGSIGVSVFDGQSVDGSDVLVRYTLSGDANLDDRVNALDFNALASNFGTGAGRVWTQADFNYDGMTNTLDFNALAINFNFALPSPMLGALVPEPAGLFGLMILGLGQLRRRARFNPRGWRSERCAEICLSV